MAHGLPLESGVLTIYQRQVANLEKDILEFRAARSCKLADSEEPVFGA